MNREFEVDSGSKASNIGRSGSYLLVRVPRHGAGQSDPCQNDVEKRHGENADATSSARSSCSFVFHVDEIIGNGPDRGEIRTRLCDFVVTLPKNFGLRIGSPLVDGVLPSFKHHHIHQLPDEDLEQVHDSGQPIARPSVVRSYFNNSHQFIVDLYNR